ncbi:clostripain-related cysteine peptidase [Herpetosiphon gulosus]|uniref:Uncharacterized protein n=1 Tax=Herpetosiphon gulosus TaxID=1973496 RepID=A0ABP9X5V2_9CHLR
MRLRWMLKLWLCLIGLSIVGIVLPATTLAEFTNSGYAPDPIGLPGDCIGVTPPSGATPICCMSGYVWFDGATIQGAIVTVETASGTQQTLNTDFHTGSPYAYYKTALAGAPLNLVAGQTISVTATYGGYTQTISHTVQRGGQQVDLVLARQSVNDYRFQTKVWPSGALGSFRNPQALAVSQLENAIYVADSDNYRIQVIKNGIFQQSWGSIGNLVDEFARISDIGLDQQGFVYVVDAGNQRIKKIKADGQVVAIWDSDQGLNQPEKIALTPMNQLYGLSVDGSVDIINTLNGQHQAHWNYKLILNKPLGIIRDIAVDQYQQVYIVDGYYNAIYKFTSNGQYIGTIGSQQPGFRPKAVTINLEQNTLMVSDIWNQKIYTIAANGYTLEVLNNQNANDLALSATGKLYGLNQNRVQQIGSNGVIIQEWGSDATDQEIRKPDGIAINAQGQLYVVDQDQARIYQFDQQQQLIHSWGGFGNSNGQFNRPSGIAIDRQNNIYIADTNNHRVQKFNSQGQWLMSIGSYGIGNGAFDRPQGISIDQQNGEIYVTEYGNHRVQKFNQQGQFLLAWGGYGTSNGHFDAPIGIALGTDQLVYVVDSAFAASNTNHSRIQVFRKDGTWVKSWGNYGLLGHPRWLLIDENNHLWLSNAQHQGRMLQRFNSDGQPLQAFGSLGQANGHFNTPVGLAAYQQNLYVSDSLDRRIQILTPMRYTKPIATITWAGKLQLTLDTDRLVMYGRGFDSSQSSYTDVQYQWYFDGVLIGNQAVLDFDIQHASIGQHIVSLRVQNQAGESSEERFIEIRIYPVPQTTWTFLLYLVADSANDGSELLAAMDSDGLGQGLLARIRQLQAQNPNVHVNVVAQIDGYNQPTRRLTLQPDGTFSDQPIGEVAMDTSSGLADFISWGKTEKPAMYYYLAIAGHGNGIQGTAWDDSSGSNQYLRITELRAALDEVQIANQPVIDVLHFDACSMGLFDIAYELRHHVRYIVASQNLAWSFFLQDRYFAQTGEYTTPQSLATFIVETYANHADQLSLNPLAEQYPYTIALLNLARSETTLTALNQVAQQLITISSTNVAMRQHLAEIRQQSQKFDSDGSYEISPSDEYIDLVHWLERLQSSPELSDPTLQSAIQTSLNSLSGANPLILADASSGARYHMPSRYQSIPTDLSGANGISLYYPAPNSPSVPTSLWAEYRNHQRFSLTQASAWDEYLTLSLGPSALPPGQIPLPEPGYPFNQRHVVYLPISRK